MFQITEVISIFIPVFDQIFFYFASQIISAPRDDDLVALIHNIHSQNIPGHGYRGFTILNNSPSKEAAVSFDKLIEELDNKTQQVQKNKS